MNRYINYISKFCNTVFYYLRYGETGIVINSWNCLRFDSIAHRNFGDELGYYLLKELTGRPISNYVDICRWGRKGKSNLLFIGSLIEDFSNSDTVVWGSGALFGGDRQLLHKPKEVRAVRGKLTRDYLLKNGVDCPEIYGDPALAVPLVYRPDVKKRYKIGLIPHVTDLSDPLISSFKDKGLHLINFAGYNDWHSVLDEICQCEAILSSSLHGLILADAYNIPNVWVNINTELLGGTFKFHDYFSGVGRNVETPFVLTEETSVAEMENRIKAYRPINVDLSKFIEAAPIRINVESCRK